MGRTLLGSSTLRPSNQLSETSQLPPPPPSVSVAQIREALNKLNYGKAAGPSGIIPILKAANKEGVELIRKLAEADFSLGGELNPRYL